MANLFCIEKPSSQFARQCVARARRALVEAQTCPAASPPSKLPSEPSPATRVPGRRRRGREAPDNGARPGNQTEPCPGAFQVSEPLARPRDPAVCMQDFTPTKASHARDGAAGPCAPAWAQGGAARMTGTRPKSMPQQNTGKSFPDGQLSHNTARGLTQAALGAKTRG